MNIVIQEIRKKNHKVFKDFFDANYTELVQYAMGYLFDMEASEDVVQDCFTYIWKNAEKLDIHSSLRGYIGIMVRNRCLNYLKSIKIKDDAKILDFNVKMIIEPQVFEAIDADEQKLVYHQILKVIDTLPDKMQQVVKMKFLQNYTYLEIAEELGISVNTVKTQLKRGKVIIVDAMTTLLALLHLQ